MAAQAKLLRAIQDLMVERVGGSALKRVGTRIVAATNRPLATLAERGRFEPTSITAERSRCSSSRAASTTRGHPGAGLLLSVETRRQRATGNQSGPADALLTYDWPGNVRELERMIEGAIATCVTTNRLDDLPIALRGAMARS